MDGRTDWQTDGQMYKMDGQLLKAWAIKWRCWTESSGRSLPVLTFCAGILGRYQSCQHVVGIEGFLWPCHWKHGLLPKKPLHAPVCIPTWTSTVYGLLSFWSQKENTVKQFKGKTGRHVTTVPIGLSDHLVQQQIWSMSPRKVKWSDLRCMAKAGLRQDPGLQLPGQCSFNPSRLPFELSHGN